MASPRPLVSAIIATRDRPEHILGAVESILAGSYTHIEVLVVDQSTDGRTAAQLERVTVDRRLRYLHTPTRGVGAARNVGLAATTGAIVAFTDDDCAARVDWLEQVVTCFAEYPQAQLLFGSVVPPSGYDYMREHCPAYLPKRPCLQRGGYGWPSGMGANMSVRRALHERIGGFDEALGPGGPLLGAEDFDLSLRTRRSGGTLLAHPAPVVVHVGGVRSHEQAPALWYRDRFGCGALAAKALRAGWYAAAIPLLSPLLSDPLRSSWMVLRGQRPSGLRKAAFSAAGTLRGFAAGLTWSLRGDGTQLRFSANR